MKQESERHRRRGRKHPVLLKDEERYRLLYGPYEPPLVKDGFLVDAVRGKVPFGTFSNALIPWPKSKRTSWHLGVGFILCGGLVRALAMESAPAISYHWGVSRCTVSNWRKALKLRRLPSGSQRLMSLGVALAKLPESRKHFSEAVRGRVLSSDHKTSLFAGIREGWKERSEARQAAYRLTGEFPRATKSDPWIPEEEELLSKLPTKELELLLGRTAKSIQARRLFLNIQACRASEPPWQEWEIKLLGTVPDEVIAEQLRRSAFSVAVNRRKRGIKTPTIQYWTAEEEAIVGKVSDAEAARRLGRSEKAVHHHRMKLGLALFHRKPRRDWTAAEDAMLGTDLDAVVAQQLKRPAGSVAARRRSKGIPVQSRVRPWTRREIRLLGTGSDVEVAEKLNRTVLAVRCKRKHCEIAPGTNRRWSPAEDELLGKAPDGEVAMKLGRALGAVKMRRLKLQIPILQSKIHNWEPWEVSLLGSAPDREVAKQLGRTILSVQNKRYELRIPSAQVKAALEPPSLPEA